MPRIDQFESIFKDSAKEIFAFEEIEIEKVLVVTDLDDYEARLFGDRTRRVLGVFDDALSGVGKEPEWRTVGKSDFSNVGELLDLVESERPDLICSYRHLHSTAWRWPHSLGSQLDVLTQVDDTPVLVMPRPERDEPEPEEPTERAVMAMTDHLTGAHRLVNHAVRFTERGGRLVLAHVEDSATFERYIDVVSKIPTINTDDAREDIARQLLKEPADYTRSCRRALEAEGLDVEIVEAVVMGHHLDEYKRLIEQHSVDLLVLNTRDGDQLAMHGLAYPLAVELRNLPLLML